MYDYTASCSLNEYNQLKKKTFSYGIFQWVPRKRGGIKPSKIVYRVRGKVDDVEKMIDAAEYICDCLDFGLVPNKKSETVKVKEV